MRIDLHAHSNVSDGTDAPGALMYLAQQAELDVVALTDHDTMRGWDEAGAQVKSSGVALVRGVEFTTRFENKAIHLLGYLFNPDSEPIRNHCETLRESRDERVRMMAQNLARDFPVSYERIRAKVGDHVPLGRPHLADELVSLGVVTNRSEAFERLLHPSGPYYVRQAAPSTLEVIKWIVDAGGKAVLAHPKAPKRGKVISDEAIADFARAGLFGVEIDHRDNDPQLRDGLLSLSAELSLTRFGSSDFHGAGKPNMLGENTTHDDAYYALIANTYLEVLHP